MMIFFLVQKELDDGCFFGFFFFCEFIKVFASPLFCTPSMRDERAVCALHQLSDAADPAAFYRTGLPPPLLSVPPAPPLHRCCQHPAGQSEAAAVRREKLGRQAHSLLLSLTQKHTYTNRNLRVSEQQGTSSPVSVFTHKKKTLKGNQYLLIA